MCVHILQPTSARTFLSLCSNRGGTAFISILILITLAPNSLWRSQNEHELRDTYTTIVSVWVCVCVCKQLPSNQSFDKQISSHQKGGGVSRWGEWIGKATAYKFDTCTLIGVHSTMHLVDPIKVHVTYTCVCVCVCVCVDSLESTIQDQDRCCNYLRLLVSESLHDLLLSNTSINTNIYTVLIMIS